MWMMKPKVGIKGSRWRCGAASTLVGNISVRLAVKCEQVDEGSSEGSAAPSA